jgi:hypothetical protein
MFAVMTTPVLNQLKSFPVKQNGQMAIILPMVVK